MRQYPCWLFVNMVGKLEREKWLDSERKDLPFFSRFKNIIREA